MLEKFEKLAGAGIELLPVPELQTHFVFHRGDFAALVGRVSRDDTFGKVGSAGLLTDRGIAPLVWRNNRAFFVLKDFEQSASDEQVSELRLFQTDLETALA